MMRLPAFFDRLGLGRPDHAASSSQTAALPRYAVLRHGDAASPSLSLDDTASQESTLLRGDTHGRSRASRRRQTARHKTSRRAWLPSTRRFWADFTLGFADGLTVPFALTAGLSSLGHTDTVLYAGLAEISAGCISMGIGGYLSARQTAAPTTTKDASDEAADEAPDEADTTDEEASAEKDAQRQDDEAAAALQRYLAPLALPLALRQQILDHVAGQPHVVEAVANVVSGVHAADAYSYGGRDATALDSDSDSDFDADDDDDDNDAAVWPVASGLSVASGYLIGGMLPLWPYFFVHHVGDGLRWSFAVCVLALFLFGFARDFCLTADAVTAPPWPLSWRQSRIPWARLCTSAGEGLQMVILGGIAAMAAVLCVRMFADSTGAASARR